jgi:hypothetical protein
LSAAHAYADPTSSENYRRPRPESFDPEFFPTPENIGRKLLAKISGDAVNFLEPHAGWGDLARLIKDPQAEKNTSWWDPTAKRKLDVIESNPDLLAILYDKGYNVVGFDWLEYSGVCFYDAIVMNPPFSNGATHLLKAWDYLYHGEISCLLNAETIRNPYTEERKRLLSIIEQHGNVEDLGACFANARRKTDADCVLVYLKKEAKEDHGGPLGQNRGREGGPRRHRRKRTCQHRSTFSATLSTTTTKPWRTCRRPSSSLRRAG